MSEISEKDQYQLIDLTPSLIKQPFLDNRFIVSSAQQQAQNISSLKITKTSKLPHTSSKQNLLFQKSEQISPKLQSNSHRTILKEQKKSSRLKKNLQEELGRYEQQSPAKNKVDPMKITYQNEDTNEKKPIKMRVSKGQELDRELRRQREERGLADLRGQLANSVSLLWLFIISGPQRLPITQAYTQYINSEEVVPVCNTVTQAKKFFQIQNALFRVVVDVRDCEQFFVFLHQHNGLNLKQNTNELGQRVEKIYIYNSLHVDKMEDGYSECLKYKHQSKKVVKISHDLECYIKDAMEDVLSDNRVSMMDNGNLCLSEKSHSVFSSFLLLNSQDVTPITTYRLTLYASLKIPRTLAHRNTFVEFVESIYGSDLKQMRYLQEYKCLDHSNPKQIIGFYIKECFFYKVLNNTLRMVDSPAKFKPISYPFVEVYRAIQYFHRPLSLLTYRGTVLKVEQVSKLKEGSYVELLGFISTSKKKEEAKKFLTGPNSYLLVFHIRTSFKGEPGYVDIHRLGLAPAGYAKEEEVLLNAMNTFKVIKMEMSQKVREIHLEYGAVQSLGSGEGSEERDIVANYRYCRECEIRHQGDLYRLIHCKREAMQAYKEDLLQLMKGLKIGNASEVRLKLGQMHLESGDLKEAYLQAVQALQHSSVQLPLVAEVFAVTEDHYNEEIAVEKLMQVKEGWMKECKALLRRANARWRAGKTKESLVDFKAAQKILLSVRENLERKKSRIECRYKCLGCICCCIKAVIKEKYMEEMHGVEEEEVDFDAREKEIVDLMLQIQVNKEEIYQYLGESVLLRETRETYEKYIGKEQYTTESLYQARDLEQLLVSARGLVKCTLMRETEVKKQTLENVIDAIRAKDPWNKEAAKYSSLLGMQCLKEIEWVQNGGGREQRQGEQILNETMNKLVSVPKYDSQGQRNSYQKGVSAFEYSLEMSIRSSGSSDPRTISAYGNLGSLHLSFNKLRESAASAQEIVEIGLNHSQSARGHLLLAKVFLMRGEVSRSFLFVDSAERTLRKALMKEPTEEYEKVIRGCKAYLEVGIVRCKIFVKQQRHDFALRSIRELQIIAKNKNHNKQNIYLASVEECRGEALFVKGQTIAFVAPVLRAIKMREVMMGKVNAFNAVAYANLSMQLYKVGEDGQEYANKSMEIFGALPENHPLSWAIMLAKAVLLNGRDKAKKLEECLQMAEQFYSSAHINIFKLKYSRAAALMSQIDSHKQKYEQMQSNEEEQMKEVKKIWEILGSLVDELKTEIVESMDMEEDYHKQISQLEIGEKNISKNRIGDEKIRNEKMQSKLNAKGDERVTIRKECIKMLKKLYQYKKDAFDQSQILKYVKEFDKNQNDNIN